VSIVCSLAGRYGYSADRAELIRVRPKLPLREWWDYCELWIEYLVRSMKTVGRLCKLWIDYLLGLSKLWVEFPVGLSKLWVDCIW
jgi:hypothetical protein